MKSTVFYTNVEYYQGQDEEGNPYLFARVHTLNHPKLGEDDVRTSRIIKFTGLGEFETQNNFYKKAKNGE
jgi:hypothetical protein